MIEVSYQHPMRRFSRKETLRTVRLVLRREAVKTMDISVVFTNDRFMRTMNKNFLGHNESTDVIAFPLDDAMTIDAEIYVNLDRAHRQAKDFGVPVNDEIRRLLIHGTLHLLGYRDHRKSEQETMRKREDGLLNVLKGR